MRWLRLCLNCGARPHESRLASDSSAIGLTKDYLQMFEKKPGRQQEQRRADRRHEKAYPQVTEPVAGRQGQQRRSGEEPRAPPSRIFFDPVRGWCYGASPSVHSAGHQSGGQLAAGSTACLFEGSMWRFTIHQNDQRIAKLTGQRFSDA
jgi:hypothetical protein